MTKPPYTRSKENDHDSQYEQIRQNYTPHCRSLSADGTTPHLPHEPLIQPDIWLRVGCHWACAGGHGIYAFLPALSIAEPVD